MPQKTIASSFDVIRLCSILLILLKTDITTALLSRPSWSQLSSGCDVATTNRKSFIAWSISNGPARLIIDNSRQIQEVAIQRKYDQKNNYNDKVYSFQRSSGTTSTGLWESKVRNAIVSKQWDEASKLLMTLNTTKLASGRDIVYVITETSRRSQNLSAIIPLLSSMVKLEKGFDYSTENDIMPLLFDCSKTNRISTGYRIVSWLYNRNIRFSAKTYSVLLKGYGIQRNEQMVDRILIECAKYAVKPDIVLFNGAIDAYIRCDNPQKAIDLFDAVMSAEYEEINTDKNRYSNKDKNEIINISKTFVNYNLVPNIRTYNTVLKALRGYKGFEKCMDVVRSMKTNNILPDSVTVNTLVDAAVITGNLHIAEDLIKHPMASPGVEAYTALISGYSQEGNVPEAFRMLNLMISKEILPNSFTLTALMKTCVTKGDWERARELLCIGSNYWNSTSNNATRYPADSLHMRLTASATPYLTAKELAVLHGSYVIGLCSLAVSSEYVEDRELYLKEAQFELITMEEKKLKPDTATMNAFIQALCAMTPARVTDALLILRAMKIEHIEPDDYTYSILFTSLGKEGYIDEALQLFRNTDRFMDTPALNALLRAFIGGPNPLQAIKVYQEMTSPNSSIIEAGKFSPSKYTFTILFLAISRSIAPQKFISPAEKLANEEQKNWEFGFEDQKAKKNMQKPIRYLTASKNGQKSGVGGARGVGAVGAVGGVGGVGDVGGASAVGGAGGSVIGSGAINDRSSGLGGENAQGGEKASVDQYVDTTMSTMNPPQQALSVLGEVIKSIGVKLNAKMNSPPSQNKFEIKGVHGNYVSNDYDDMKERDERIFNKKEGDKKSQPLVYDDNSGRFYEQKQDSAQGLNSTDINITKPKLKKESYTAEDIFEKYGPPDNLDILRGNYVRDQEAKILETNNKNKNIVKNVKKVNPINEELENEYKSDNSDLTSMSSDELLQKLFLSMRFDYNIEADEIMISALNSLFTTTNNFQSHSQLMLLDKEKESSSYNNNDYNNYKPNTPPVVSLGWAKRQVLSKKTAELVFADLVISGWHPSMFQPILYSCGYPQRKVIELLKEEENNIAIKKIRASAASIRIFKKHDWNNIESGWSGFFQ